MKIIVDKPTFPQQSATITYSAPRPVNIGDIFYRVECGELQHFREPCRVCGDKRTLTINGITFACPHCNTEKTTISVAPYIVRRYRVNVIKEAALDYEWKLGDRYVYFRFYRKVGHGYADGYYSKNGGSFEMRSDDFNRNYNLPYDGPRIKTLARIQREIWHDTRRGVQNRTRPEIKLTEVNNEHRNKSRAPL